MVFVLVAVMMFLTATFLIIRDAKNRDSIKKMEKQIKLLYEKDRRKTRQTGEASDAGEPKASNTGDKSAAT